MQLWTFEHLVTLVPAVLIMVGIAFLLKKTIGKKSLEIRMIPFQIVASILLIVEIIKQIYSLIDGYDLYHIPLHFCSLFIFMIPLMAFYKGKYKDVIGTITSTICIALFLFMLIYPNLIYSSGNITNYFKGYIDFHTVTFHNLVLFEYVLILFLNLHPYKKKNHLLHIIIFAFLYAFVAATMAQLLKTNFANFYECNIPVVEQFRQSVISDLGYIPTQIIYVCVLIVLHVLFLIMCYYLYNLIHKIHSKIVNK